MASAKTRQRLANEPWRRPYGTKRWKETRRRTLIRAGRMCQRCGNDRSLDVHHITALKDGGAPFDPANLEVLCRVATASPITPAVFFEATGRHTGFANERSVMAGEFDPTRERKDALDAFLESRLRDGFEIETHTDTHAIVVERVQRMSFLSRFRGRDAAKRYVVSVDERGEVTMIPAEPKRS